jgi:translation initiation factor 1
VAQSKPSFVLFLCAGADERGAAAEASFNAVAARMGLPWRARRVDPSQAAETDLQGAVAIVALDEAGCRPLVQQRFATWAERVRYWQLPPGPATKAAVEREVMALVARLLGGKAEATDTPAQEDGAVPEPKKPAERPLVRVGRETKGRRGKGVTTVFDLPLGESEIEQLAARLKQRCGTGGTVKGGVIEIQGDHRDRLVGELESLGFRVKRAGG